MTFFRLDMIKMILFTFVVSFGLSLTARAGERVVIGISPSLTSTLSIIAKQQGCFSRQGLDAEIRVLESGGKSVEMMLNDEIDISESAIFSLVSNSFNRKDFKIYTQASISGNDNMIIARRDKGIQKITDLTRKRVGTRKGGFSRYVLDLMLLDAGIDSREVNLVFEEDPARVYQMLSSGDLDAACLFGGWVDKAAGDLKDNSVIFHDEKLVRVTLVHAAKTSTFERRPGLFPRILKAYIEAEDAVKKNPDAALKTVVEYLKLDMANAQKVWQPKMVHVALEQSLIKDMENMAQWQIDTGYQKGEKIANYLDLIHFQSLTKVDPKRVTIAH